MKRKDPPESKHSYLCSEHFSEDCFIRCVGGSRHLNYKIQFFTAGKAKAEKLPFIAQLHMRQQRVKSTCNLTYKELPYFKIFSNNSAIVALLTWFSQLCRHCSLFFFACFEVVSPPFLLVPKELASGLKALGEVSY